MKVPSIKTSEGVIFIGAALLAAYAIYRIVSTGSTIATTVKDGLSDAYNTVADAANLAVNKARTSSIGADPAPTSDESQAEIERLNRQAGLVETVQSPYDPFSASAPVLGQATVIRNADQQDSPDASGLSVWSVLP